MHLNIVDVFNGNLCIQKNMRHVLRGLGTPVKYRQKEFWDHHRTKVVFFNSEKCLVSKKNAKQKIVLTDFLKNGLEGHFSWFFGLFSPIKGPN